MEDKKNQLEVMRLQGRDVCIGYYHLIIHNE